MPWAGPRWWTVTAQVTGRYFGEAQRRRRTRRAAGGGAGARPQAQRAAPPSPSMLALGLLRGPAAVYGACAHGACASVRDACAPL